MGTFTTGQIFLLCGTAGLVIASIAAIAVSRRLKRLEREILEQIWREYR